MHDDDRDTRVGGVDPIRQILADWDDTCRRPDVPRILRRWARHEPALAGLSSLPEILHRLAADHGNYDQRDAILVALLRIAQQRSGRRDTPTPDAAVAGRVVLQAMAPAAWRIARTGSQFRSADYDDVQSHTDRLAAVMAALWETILTYNLDRPSAGHKVASTLKLDTLNRLTRGGIWRTHNLRANREITVDYDQHAPSGIWSRHSSRTTEDTVDYGIDCLPDPAEATVESLLGWARHHDLLDHPDLEVLTVAYQDGLGHHAAAARLGITPAAFRKRVSRAVTRLRDAYEQAWAVEHSR